MMILAGTLLCFTLATGAWTDSQRYGKDYIDDTNSNRYARCIPCEQRGSIPNRNPESNGLEYRGNGADNLGYDWSPKAWGGRAFPSKEDEKQSFPEDNWNNRDGRRMPWNEKCRDCDRQKNYNPFLDKDSKVQNRDRNYPAYRPDSWFASTERPQNYEGNSGTFKDVVSTVTSSVLGVRLRDDKRLPVEWSEDSRSMRWDGFRNGMPWQRPDGMDRREDSFNSWRGNDPSSSRWNQDGRGGYAADWNYNDRNPQMAQPNTYGNRWGDKSGANDRRYNQVSSGYPFESSYPQTNGYADRPSYSTTSSYPQKPLYHYSPNGRPLPQYPIEPAGNRPNYETSNRPPHQTTSNPYRPQPEIIPWTSRPDSQQWTTPRPNQNYLPQNNPSYNYEGQSNNRPYQGTPGTAIWNRPPHDRPSGNKKPQGFYTGFITEIHDPNYSPNGNQYTSNRPNSGSNHYGNTGQGYPENNNMGSRWPNYNMNSLSTNYNRYPTNQQPTSGYDRPSQGNRNQAYGGDRNVFHEGTRYPNYETRPSRYPEPTSFDNRYPGSNYDNQKKPPNNYYDSNGDRDWNYSNDQREHNRPHGTDSNIGYNKPYPYGNDRDTRPFGSDSDRYPSRPGSGEHDRGPSPASDSSSWNYGEEDKDGTYRRSGGSYPLYKGGQYFTSSYLASASTPAAANQDPPNKKSTDETTASTMQE